MQLIAELTKFEGDDVVFAVNSKGEYKPVKFVERDDYYKNDIFITGADE